MRVDLVKTYHFEAAHSYMGPGLDPRLHGHSYRVEIVVAGECDAHKGWLMDYADITRVFDEVHPIIDHRRLEDVEGLDDTSLDGLERWFVTRLREGVHGLKDVDVGIVGQGCFTLEQTPNDSLSSARDRLRFGFEAAHALPNVPEDHKCRRMHGHSFSVEAGVKDAGTSFDALLEALYGELDRRCLNEIDGLENPTSETLCKWIWDRVLNVRLEPEIVVVAETCTARCIYHGE